MENIQYGKKWSEEETILAFNLYCHVPFSKIDKRNPEIIALAQLLGRTPSSVGLKMANLAHFDPELRKRSVTGMGHASKSDEVIVQRFLNNWEELSYQAKQIEAKFRNESIEEARTKNQGQDACGIASGIATADIAPPTKKRRRR